MDAEDDRTAGWGAWGVRIERGAYLTTLEKYCTC